MGRKRIINNQNQEQESFDMGFEEAVNEKFKEIEQKVDALAGVSKPKAGFHSAVIDEGIDRLQLFYMLLSATHQGFLANQYSDIINSSAEGAKVLELEKIFGVTMLAMKEYERLLGSEVNESR